MPYTLLRKTLLLPILLAVTAFGAGKPSWQTFGLFIDPVRTVEEANRIQAAVVAYDVKQIKAASGLTPENGFLLIEHDHHNIRFQDIAAAIHKLGNYKITVPLLIPDYQRVQGTPIGERLHSILNNPDLPYQIERIDPVRGLFHIVLPAGPPQSKGFNFGDLAHPLSDPVNYGGIGLPMSFPGLKGTGGMSKDPKVKAIQFRKAGKKEKPYDPVILDAHRAHFPTCHLRCSPSPFLPPPKLDYRHYYAPRLNSATDGASLFIVYFCLPSGCSRNRATSLRSEQAEHSLDYERGQRDLVGQLLWWDQCKYASD